MNMRVLNLCWAVVWIVTGVGMLAEWYTSPQPRFVVSIGGQAVSLGWLALAFAAYNLVKWWARGAAMPTARQPVNPLRRPARSEPKEYHPEFDFTRPADPAEPNA